MTIPARAQEAVKRHDRQQAAKGYACYPKLNKEKK